MSNDLIQEAPSVGIKARLTSLSQAASADFHLVEHPFLTYVTLRGNPQHLPFVSAVQQALQLPLPAVGRMASLDGRSAVWMGPDEWLIHSAEDTGAELEGALRGALTGQHSAVVDGSSGYTQFALSGARVRDVLAKGCPLDLHPREFPPGRAVQSHFFKAGITLIHSGPDQFQLIVRRSFAEYCCLMLLDAGKEFLR